VPRTSYGATTLQHCTRSRPAKDGWGDRGEGVEGIKLGEGDPGTPTNYGRQSTTSSRNLMGARRKGVTERHRIGHERQTRGKSSIETESLKANANKEPEGETEEARRLTQTKNPKADSPTPPELPPICDTPRSSLPSLPLLPPHVLDRLGLRGVSDKPNGK
jgi:hypothetical protein